MTFLSRLKDIDCYSIAPQIYLNGRKQKTSLLGFGLTIFTFICYFCIFVYFLAKMLDPSNVNVVTYTEYSTRYLSFNLTHENTYFAFGVEDPDTYDYFIDDSIYYLKALFKRGVRNEKTGVFEWNVTELEIEPCNINNFGEEYKSLFQKKPLNQMHCIKNMTEILEGHFSQDQYSFFMVQIFECKNTTENNNKCKPKDNIDKYLNGTFISILFESVSVDPKDYEHPGQPVVENIYTTFSKTFHKEIHIYLKIIDIISDKGIIFTSNKRQSVIQADSFQDMFTNIPKDSMCDITIKLSDKFEQMKRTYSKLQEVLANLGGFIKVISAVVYFISLAPIETVYEKSIINKLYTFSYKQNTTRQSNIFTKDSNHMNELKDTSCTRKELMNNYISSGSKVRDYIGTSKILPLELTDSIRKKITFEEKHKLFSKLKLSKTEIWLMKLCQGKYNSRKNVYLFNEGSFLFKEKMDLISLFRLFVGFELIKVLLFNQNQLTILNYEHKPILFFEPSKINNYQTQFQPVIKKDEVKKAYQKIREQYELDQSMKINKKIVDNSYLFY